MGMKRVFVVTNATINNKSESFNLAVGEIAAYGMNSATGREERATPSNTLDTLNIVLGRGANLLSLRSTQARLPVSRRKLRWEKSLYAAPVAQQIQVTSDCLGTNEFDSMILRIGTRFRDDDSGNEPEVKTYSASGVYASATLLYAALAAAINKDTNVGYTATSSGAGVLITANDGDILMDVGYQYFDGQTKQICMTCQSCTSTITRLNEGSSGSGTYKQLMKHLAESRGHLGTHFDWSRMVPNPGDSWANINPAGTWDLYFLDFQNMSQPTGDPGMVFDVWEENVIAVAAGTNFDAFTQAIDKHIGQNITTAIF